MSITDILPLFLETVIMISREEAYKISQKSDPTSSEMVDVIVRYIFDKKSIDISNKRINIPVDVHQAVLMSIMYSTAKDFYQHG